MDGVHDMGGMHGFGDATWDGAEAVFHEGWERRAFALYLATGFLGLRTGSGRAKREEMQPAHYIEASYYERWMWSMEQSLLEEGTIATGEVDAWVERLRAGEAVPEHRDAADAQRARAWLAEEDRLAPAVAPRFAVGDRVRVRRMYEPRHHRSPRYVRGVTGVVEAIRGVDGSPETLYDHPERPVYAIRFRSQDLFGQTGEPAWTVVLDLWEHYLETTDD